jgi:RNA polymerase sigma factor (sigma-70 family)
MDEITDNELAAALLMNTKLAVRLGRNLSADLESAGREAIVRAMQTFERERGTFLTYARAFIRKYQIRERKNILTAVHLGTNDYSPAASVGLEFVSGYIFEEMAVERDFTFLYMALATLEQSERDIIHMYYWDEWTLERIGKLLGIHLESVRQRKAATLARLRKRIVRT